MAKVVFIGAGSFGFTRTVAKDMFNFDYLKGGTIGLVDINEERLRMARKNIEKLVKEMQIDVKIESSVERKDILSGADAILITILQGDTSIWQHDILIPKKYGVDINVGDTRGVAGIFRALRTIPVMYDICKDIENICPDALVLNYTNPMAMLCHAMQRKTKVNFTGLCHSVQGTIKRLAKWADAPEEEIDFTCAGLNHLSWYLKLEHKGRDLYPSIREKIENDEEVYNEEIVRNEMFLNLGYYVTESSGHNSEYNWWFRKSPELIEKYCTTGTGWNPGIHAYILDEYRRREKDWKKEFNEWIDSPEWDDPEKKAERLKKSHEYASNIINAYLGNDQFIFNGNVSNNGIISNLPQGCCVEVPVITRRGSLTPLHVGNLPMNVLPITSICANIEMMAVEACFTGDRELVQCAVSQSPLTSAVLDLRESRKMVDELFEINKEFLPQFN